MIPAARREEIKRVILSESFVSATELASRLNRSLSTVRRDLIELEQEGFIIRSRGGGQTAVNATSKVVLGATYRAPQHSDEKVRIAQKAAELVSKAGCIVLDAGTTNLEVARHLHPEVPLRVITDGIEIAYELKDRENVTVIVCGGILHRLSYHLYGASGEQMLDNMHAQVCVMGAVGLSISHGLTKHDIEALPMRKKMIDISNELICVADSSKLDITALVSVCSFETIDTLITDSSISCNMQTEFEAAGCKVIQV